MLGMLGGLQGITLYRDTLLVIQRKNMKHDQVISIMQKIVKDCDRRIAEIKFRQNELLRKGMEENE